MNLQTLRLNHFKSAIDYYNIVDKQEFTLGNSEFLCKCSLRERQVQVYTSWGWHTLDYIKDQGVISVYQFLKGDWSVQIVDNIPNKPFLPKPTDSFYYWDREQQVVERSTSLYDLPPYTLMFRKEQEAADYGWFVVNNSQYAQLAREYPDQAQEMAIGFTRLVGLARINRYLFGQWTNGIVEGVEGAVVDIWLRGTGAEEY